MENNLFNINQDKLKSFQSIIEKDYSELSRIDPTTLMKVIQSDVTLQFLIHDSNLCFLFNPKIDNKLKMILLGLKTKEEKKEETNYDENLEQ